MNKRTFLLTLVLLLVISIFLLTNISALCSEGQIDINTASIEELDKLSGIGPAKAQAIIDTRPFDSIDELIDVKGIGEVTLENIKTQGLACVENENGSNEEAEEGEEDKKSNDNETHDEIAADGEEIVTFVSLSNEVEPETIVLNPLDPKAINITENKNLKKSTAVMGFAAFCVLLGVLFIIKRKRYKNEFK